jgi:hypothetical protein
MRHPRRRGYWLAEGTGESDRESECYQRTGHDVPFGCNAGATNN